MTELKIDVDHLNDESKSKYFTLHRCAELIYKYCHDYDAYTDKDLRMLLSNIEELIKSMERPCGR